MNAKAMNYAEVHPPAAALAPRPPPLPAPTSEGAPLRA